MTKYVLNTDTLEYVKVNENIFLFKFCITAFIIGICLGIWIGGKIQLKIIEDEYILTKHDMTIGGRAWRDSIFTDYQKRADLYLNRVEFKGTPMKGAQMALAAENAYDSTGIIVPLELALAQCQWESGMGLQGKSPTNNPYNIGEYDKGTVMWFNNTFEGVQAYYYYMSTKYLPCSTVKELLNDFRNCNGKRYASSNYAGNLPQQYNYIKKWLAKNNKITLALSK